MAVIVLDRDGVINFDSDQYIKTVDEWRAIPGAIAAIAALSKAGHDIYVATNQSGIGRGFYSVETLNAMHDKMLQLLSQEGGELKGIYYCPHHPDDNCQCRKPLPGMLEAMQQEHQVDFTDSWFVGDSLRDLQSGLSKGCKPALVRTGKGEATLAKGLPAELEHTLVFEDLADFAKHLLK
ncbi:MAG TPA: D-glycero-beta-D-manno-heptose 1,7-bisphosphate 7-phosphatase [Alcanivoracaceae bacterium]|nr:D-glycero-beta-D-manno-heptose 1,7-bisphosphate 7-phosphatase [Alcanivoracaceae bacterium]